MVLTAETDSNKQGGEEEVQERSQGEGGEDHKEPRGRSGPRGPRREERSQGEGGEDHKEPGERRGARRGKRGAMQVIH